MAFLAVDGDAGSHWSYQPPKLQNIHWYLHH